MDDEKDIEMENYLDKIKKEYNISDDNNDSINDVIKSLKEKIKEFNKPVSYKELRTAPEWYEVDSKNEMLYAIRKKFWRKWDNQEKKITKEEYEKDLNKQGDILLHGTRKEQEEEWIKKINDYIKKLEKEEEEYREKKLYENKMLNMGINVATNIKEGLTDINEEIKPYSEWDFFNRKYLNNKNITGEKEEKVNEYLQGLRRIQEKTKKKENP